MINLPWYDPDPRRALSRLNKETKERDIILFKEDGASGNIIQVSPIFLAFAILTAINEHLKLLLTACEKFEIYITREQTKKLHSEILVLHYFIITIPLAKYISNDQFALFVLRTRVALLDVLPKNGIGNWLLSFNPFSKSRRDNEVEISLLEAFQNGEKFYVRDELSEEDRQELASDLALFEIKEDVFKKNVNTQFFIKGNYRLCNILSARENPAQFIPLFGTNMSIIETSLEVAQKMRPVWHLPQDKRVLVDYKMQDQE